ncbi:MAG: ABC transporter ATP-binding protein [Eubacteriaceae bacterium]|nr:ABC transporter ATP-binding protein [Eubacteriaceae bacterium]
MLKLENVSKSYDNGKTNAVDGISLEVNAGEIFGFLGPNGAGKTTTIKMIVGLLKADSGSIRINGINNSVDPIKAKMQMSYVPDNPEVFEKLKGIEYLNFMADVYSVSKEDRTQAMERYLDLFDMKKAVNDPISSYSHGMRQKIVLTGALLHDPQVFILDEPLVGLDPKSAFNLKEVMRERCDQGKCVFFSTHVLEVAEKICDRVAIIDNGKIIAQGTMEELKGDVNSHESLENIFLELTER